MLRSLELTPHGGIACDGMFWVEQQDTLRLVFPLSIGSCPDTVMTNYPQFDGAFQCEEFSALSRLILAFCA